jgi:hypothetical protein
MTYHEPSVNRWYDADPALSRALACLKEADNRYRAQVALNIICVILEHQQLASLRRSHEAEGPPTLPHLPTVEAALAHAESLQHGVASRRWFDADQSLRSAMLLLEAMDDAEQRTVIPAIAQHIEATLAAL